MNILLIALFYLIIKYKEKSNEALIETKLKQTTFTPMKSTSEVMIKMQLKESSKMIQPVQEKIIQQNEPRLIQKIQDEQFTNIILQ